MATNLPLTNKINKDSRKSSLFREMSAQFGDGYQQVAPKGINNKYDTWELEWVALLTSEKDTVEAVLDSVGSWGILLWTPSYESVTKKFRLSKEGYTRTRVGGTFKISCKLIQVFDL